MKGKMRGLEVVFRKQLRETLTVGGITPGGAISPGGAIFPLEYLQSYDLKKNLIVLRADYEAYQSLSDGCIIFQSDAPNTWRMYICKDLIVKITDLATGKIVFPS